MASSLDHRRDVRSVEVFGHNIKDFTEREHHWSIALKYDFQQRGLMCEVSDNGVDGTGDLITDKLANYNADKKYALSNGKDMLVEIKTAPEWLNKFFTFKVFCLKKCIADGAWVSVPRVAGYYLFKPQSLEKMVAEYKHDKYRGFSKTDWAVRIPMDDITQMVTDNFALYREWSPKAVRYIKVNLDILNREKKK